MLFFLLPLGISLATAGDLRVEGWSEEADGTRVKAAAEVYVDGRPTGSHTPTVIHDLSPGSHQIELRSGCAVAREDVEIAKGASQHLVIELKTLATLSIEFKPSEASVQLDGKPWNPASPTIQVPCGEHTLSASLVGYQTELSNFELAPGEIHGISLELEPLGTGILLVHVEPDSARIFIDGEDHGKGQKPRQVYEGPHVVEARKRGFITGQNTVFVAENETYGVKFVLEPETMKTAPVPKMTAPVFSSPTKAAGYGLTAGGAVMTIYGGVQLLQTMAAYSEYRDRVETVREGHRDPAYAVDFYQSEVATRAPRMRASLVIGASTLTGGLVLATRF